MRCLVLIVAALAVSTMAQPAFAQRRGGEFKGDPAQFFATCALKINEGGSRKVLRTTAGSKPEMKLLRQLSVSGCLVGEARKHGIASVNLRAGLAQALYLKDQKTPLTKKMPGQAPDFAAIANADGTALELAIATCVGRFQPVASDSFLRAKADSPEEAAGLAALRDPLAKCVPPTRQLRLTKQLLRGLLAEAMYLDLHDEAAK